ncbi:hypothetical protein [Bacteroides sp. 51]|uniref:hypothetical protein n=1 Tax=Bacteroides sp. 51 TaxID=2302938 RepID=UPI0013D7F48A|nr:hypothetical protein [Bacteroides sp. 51]NDV84092.1 hypothetical protein [Bacteroides sp. 51]
MIIKTRQNGVFQPISPTPQTEAKTAAQTQNKLIAKKQQSNQNNTDRTIALTTRHKTNADTDKTTITTRSNFQHNQKRKTRKPSLFHSETTKTVK